MYAVVVEGVGSEPTWQDFPEPSPAEGEVVVDVLAAALHPRVRSQISGTHYASEGVYPLVPGVDGVARFPDGSIRYFAVLNDARGSMAERVAVDPRASIAVPAGADVAVVAAGVNPVMSSWVALRRRLDFAPGGTVLVLGATGGAGRAAVQVTRHLGAARVIASGRNADAFDELRRLGADVVVPLSDVDAVAAAARDADVVLDYVWGAPSSAIMSAMAATRTRPEERWEWVSIGATAGADTAVASEALRSSALTIIGSGQGSIRRADFLGEMPAIIAAIADGTISVDSSPLPMSEVRTAWREPARFALIP